MSSAANPHVGLFGGSFNPPHLAHLVVAERACEAAGLDEVVWMPSPRPPHKTGADAGALAPERHRLAMTRLAVQDHPAFSVSDLEVQRAGLSYTVDTLRTLHEERPGVQWHLVIGGDSLASFTRWREPEAILDLARLVVYRRPGAGLGDVPEHVLARTTFADAPLLEVSATDLRARLAEGRSVRYLVPDAVRTYIAEHGLYERRSERG